MEKFTTDKFDEYKVRLNPKNPLGTRSFKIDNSLVSEFEDIFSSLKGEPKSIRSDKGDLHLPYVIDFKANKKNLKVFKKKINQNNGQIILLIDGSGSTRNTGEDTKIRNLTANLFKSISEIARIELNAYVYGGNFDDRYELCISEINELENCEKIVGDNESFGSTPTHYAIDYVTKLHEDQKGKKLIICITDGRPDVYQNHRSVYGGNNQILKLESKKALIEAEAKGFDIFGIGIDLDELDSFKNMFRDEFVNVKDSNDIKKYLVEKLSDFVGGIKG